MMRNTTPSLLNTLLIGLFLGLISTSIQAQKTPRLVVGIVVDQMRYDYLYRYSHEYGPDGFNKLLRGGMSCEQTWYDYVPTYTAPGHACIYTGTDPAHNGIVSNDWYAYSAEDRRRLGRTELDWFAPKKSGIQYVTRDFRYQGVGTTDSIVGMHSPRVLLSSTVTDELKLAHNNRSKVVGVCLKDRGSILPAGHFPDACFWFDDLSGDFITSAYYTDQKELPEWVRAFNDRDLVGKYLDQKWDRLPNKPYSEHFEGWAGNFDQGAYKKTWLGSFFPHYMPALKNKGGNGLIRFTPWGNTLTLDFALAAIEQLQLGTDADADFLCLSFSATDYVGHQFGVHSIETEDTYLRLDQDLARLITYLETKFGKDEVLIFLTADHGGAETIPHLRQEGGIAGLFDEAKIAGQLDTFLWREYPKLHNQSVVLASINQQVWFDQPAIRQKGISVDSLMQTAARWLARKPGVAGAWTVEELLRLPADLPYVVEMRRGIHPRRSGDVVFLLDPAWIDDVTYIKGGTTHGSPYAYDAHVPLLWYGSGIQPGRYYGKVSVRDIAPTTSAILRIQEPNACTGAVIEAVMSGRK
jgi:predicted AlkP superfamily pyrophosphatase or phosphodiesterase